MFAHSGKPWPDVDVSDRFELDEINHSDGVTRRPDVSAQMEVGPQKRWTMLPQQDGQRPNAKHHRSEVHTKISRPVHIGVGILPCMPSCWLDRPGNGLKPFSMMSGFGLLARRMDGGQRGGLKSR